MSSEIQRIKGLQPIEIVVLENVFNILLVIDRLNESVLTLLTNGDFIEAQKAVQQASYFKYTPQFLQNMQQQVLDYCSVDTLDKIVNSVPFETTSFLGTTVTIDARVLPKITSSTTIKHYEDKASIYKRLGATIVL